MKSEDFVKLVLSGNNDDDDDAVDAWQRLTFDALRDYGDQIEEIVALLPNDDVENVFTKIVEEMFSDGIVTRGRIVTMLAFAVHLQQKNDVDLSKEAAFVIRERLFDWLLCQFWLCA
jgi:hypothetical protein